MDKEKLDQLSDNGKKEVKEITIKQGGKTYNAVIVMDFSLYRKALNALIDTTITGKGGSQNVSVNVDEAGAGDKVLFLGWVEGDEEIRTNFRLRVKASKMLGAWVQELANEDEDTQEEEKKS